MLIGIGSRADSLCLQTFRRIRGRHFTRNHCVQIFLQQQLIDNCKSIFCLYDFQTSSIISSFPGPLYRRDHKPPTIGIQSQKNPFILFKIRRISRDTDNFITTMFLCLFSIPQGKATIRRYFYIFMESASIVSTLQQHSNGVHTVFPRHEKSTYFPSVHYEICIFISDRQFSHGNLCKVPIESVCLCVFRKRYIPSRKTDFIFAYP